MVGPPNNEKITILTPLCVPCANISIISEWREYKARTFSAHYAELPQLLSSLLINHILPLPVA